MSKTDDFDIITRMSKKAGEESTNKLMEKIRLQKENEKYIRAAIKKYNISEGQMIAIGAFKEIINEKDGAWVPALLWVSDDELEE